MNGWTPCGLLGVETIWSKSFRVATKSDPGYLSLPAASSTGSVKYVLVKWMLGSSSSSLIRLHKSTESRSGKYVSARMYCAVA